MTRPTLCVAIPTYLREQVLVATIRQVLRQQPVPDEILVVDQTPFHDAETEIFLSENHGRGLIRHLHQGEPSLTKARNRILAEAKSEVVIFIDDDVELPQGYVAAHAANYEDSSVKLVAGTVLSRQQLDAHLRDLGNSSDVRAADSPGDVRGANHSVWRATAIAAGGYDENFIGSALGEEEDFSIRLGEQCGEKQIYDPKSWLIHLRSPTGGCRIANNPAWSEWQKTLSIWLFGFRHHWRHPKLSVLTAFRVGPGRKENILHPWRQPFAWLSFFYAAFVALKKVNHVVSPFTMEGHTKKRD
jgi:glycosyltransferase involved in cell wall biosynthesis